VRDLIPSDPLQLGGFAVETQEGAVVVVSNLTPGPFVFDVTGLAAAAISSRVLDIRTVERATDDPIGWRHASGERIPVEGGAFSVELGPYGVVRFDTVP
jgi:hypothetical protein